MNRFQLTAAAGALAGLTVLGVAAARAEGHHWLAALTPIFGQDKQDAQDRAQAIDAFAQVLAHQADTLGGRPPGNDPVYAPVYPNAFVADAALDPNRDSGGTIEYAAAANVGTLLHFFEDAAARDHLPFKTIQITPDGATFTAGDARRQVTVKLTKQFKTSTQADVSYS